MTQQEMLMRQWVDKLNQASEAYYNGKGELMSDYEWDALFRPAETDGGGNGYHPARLIIMWHTCSNP